METTVTAVTVVGLSTRCREGKLAEQKATENTGE
jgi:hypothetical protein